MANPALDIPAFRIQFPQFASETQFPDVLITAQWNLATVYYGDVENWVLNGARQQQVLNLLTAHLLALGVLIAAGTTGAGGLVKSATVDKVSVTMEAPPFKDGWGWWLLQTPYGAQLNALLKIITAGGYYFGGSPERYAFRRVGGGFGPPGY